ncbi:hypothetical protein [Pilimelia columellifera]|uniref:MFS transporter n=1 Tax=Pilimelia columellifera subsp. columellifera TaxID=706583 RepID=A0ABN3NSP2_9ACTN
MPERRARLDPGSTQLLACVSLAAVLTAGWLLAPPMGTDLAAQIRRADFFDAHGLTPVDLSWYGGVSPLGYSLLSPPLMAAFGGGLWGARWVGALSAVASAGLAAVLLRRADAARPLVAGLVAAVCVVGNLASGRITFALGMALALAALLAATGSRRPLALTTLAAAGATAASPVAGLFLALAGGAWGLARLWERRSMVAALTVAAPLCLPPLLVMTTSAWLFGDGGAQPFGAQSLLVAVATCVVVALAVGPRRPTLLVGAALATVLLVLAYLVPSPIGSNALRLPMLWAAPLIVGFGRWPTIPLALVVALVVWWQPPVVVGDLARAGDPPHHRAYYAGLAAELRRLPPGRVEAVPLKDHGESTQLGLDIQLARGWQRQLDVGENPLFYRPGLNPDTYRRWLAERAVTYVALADADPDQWAVAEAAVIRQGVPYLAEVWRDDRWRLLRVAEPTAVVAAPAALRRLDAASVAFEVEGPAVVTVNVRASRWLRLSGPGCLRVDGDRVRVDAGRAGAYTMTSSLWSPGPWCQ